MAIFQALFSYLGKSAGKILQAFFGWAVLAIFGDVKESDKTLFSGTVGLAAAWPLLLIGIAFPKIALVVLAFVPIPKWIPPGVIRAFWIVVALAVPLIVANVIAKHTHAAGANGSFLHRFWQGVRVTVAIGTVFFIVFVGAPIRHLATVARRLKDEHIPLVVPHGCYHIVAREAFQSLSSAGFKLEKAQAPWLDRTVTNLLRSLGGEMLQKSLPEDIEYFRNSALSVIVTMNGVQLQGPEDVVARAHGFVSEAMTFGPALQTTDAMAQQFERELKDIWEVFKSEPGSFEHSGTLLLRVEEIAKELAEAHVPFEQWQILYRELLQMTRAIDAKPQLLEEQAIATMRELQKENEDVVAREAARNKIHATPLEQLSTAQLIGEIGPGMKTLVEQEVALAKAELKADLQKEVAMAKLLGVAGLLALLGVAMLFVTAAFALALVVPAWLAALIVAGALLVSSALVGLSGWAKRVRKPLDSTQQTIKEDVRWARNRMA